MTIKRIFTLKYDDAKLAFGVPLEDLFPVEDIHPYIKYLFNITYKTIARNHYSIEHIIENMQGTVQYRLLLKEDVEECILFNSIKKLPGALLWVIRHFIGLLPLPVLPHYANGIFFQWQHLSDYCERYLQSSSSDDTFSCKINVLLLKDIVKLPAANLLFIKEFFNFLRKLIVLPFQEGPVRKYSVITLVQYYCSALFSRPYQPGYVKSRDKYYAPLFIYMLLKWHNLKGKICKLNNDTTMCAGYQERTIEQSYEFTQVLDTISENRTEEDEAEEENIEALTDMDESSQSTNHSNETYKSTTSLQIQLEPFLNPIKQKQCVANYGWIKPESSCEGDLDGVSVEHSCMEIGWHTPPETRFKHQETQTINFPDSPVVQNETIYDDARSTLEGELNEHHEKTNVEDFEANDLLETEVELCEPILKGSYGMMDKDLYKICYDGDNNDTSCSNHGSYGSEEVKNNKKELFYGSNMSFSANSKSSFKNFKAIVTNLDILKLFKKKKKLAPASSSDQDVRTKIKYRKMKSNTF